MIRVFPSKTKWSPTDPLAFVGDPPLFRPVGDHPVKVSCTLSWDLNEAERLQRSWSRFYSDVQLGGPALGDPGGEFTPGLFVREGVTITSRGCTKDCPWCFVPKREGWIRELPIRDGWDVADNNLLACSQEHVEGVFEMLRRQPRAARFSGGLDAEIFNEWHANLLVSIRYEDVFFAADYPGALRHIEKVSELMRPHFRHKAAMREKLRCYVLIGFDGESVSSAQRRLESVYQLGLMPFAMPYRGEESGKRVISREWSKLQKTFSRPAATKSHMRSKAAWT